MNQTLEVIKRRQSVRKFKKEQVENEKIEAIIEAGSYAPSAHGAQSWHFSVIQDQELLAEMNIKIKEIAKESPVEAIRNMANSKTLNIFYNAPTVVLISGDDSKLMPEMGCILASQNILLAAESLEIGGCWNGFIGNLFEGEEAEAYKKILKVPEGYTPYHGILLGYPESTPKEPKARKEDILSYIR